MMKLIPTSCWRDWSMIPVIVRLPVVPLKHSMYDADPRDCSCSQLLFNSASSAIMTGSSALKRRRKTKDLRACESLPFLIRKRGVSGRQSKPPAFFQVSFAYFSSWCRRTGSPELKPMQIGSQVEYGSFLEARQSSFKVCQSRQGKHL